MQAPLQAHSHRIIGSAIYDGLILLGLLMIAGFIAVSINFSITGSETINGNIFFQAYLILVVTGYFLYFWKKSGQTVGMKAWRLRLVSLDNTPFTYRQLITRLLVAIPAFTLLCIGVLWQYLDKKKLNWQDRASQTKLVYIPKPK